VQSDITVTLTPKELELLLIAIENLQMSFASKAEPDKWMVLEGVCRKLIKLSQGEG
jgi:hypothetical protein